jgi:CIC family chloride channel protein
MTVAADSTEVGGDGAGGVAGLVRIVVVAAVCGVAVGLVAGSYRWCLRQADRWRLDLVDWAGRIHGAAWLVPVAVVVVGAVIGRWVVRLSPLAAGSGVQDVEAIWRGDAPPAPLPVLPVKFVGGVVAIGSGLVLGREGPSVHMGSVIGSATARRLGMGGDDIRVLQAALGGAGLAVAFNAPLGGALFVFEEVTKSFRLRLVLVTFVGCAVAVAFSRGILGDGPDFLVTGVITPPGWQIVLYAAFGCVTGAVGVAYSVLVVRCLDGFDRVRRLPPEVKAAAVGGVVGLLLCVAPLAVGGGDQAAQRVLDGGVGLAALSGLFLVRFLTGPLSYSVGAPGGIFAPLLAIGAVWGAVCQGSLVHLLPSLGDRAAPLAIVGMAAFFAAVVRAPFTGIVLIVEMTATTTLLVPLLVACAGAVLVATLLRSAPIYDTLRERMTRTQTTVPGTGTS